MNVSGKAPDLILIFTGSSRDKLAHLVMNSRLPFYGSQVTPFPLLDRNFSDEFTKSVNRALAADNQLEPEAVYEAFVMVGHRPEVLRHLIGMIELANGSPNLSSRLKDDATLVQERGSTKVPSPTRDRSVARGAASVGRRSKVANEALCNSFQKRLQASNGGINIRPPFAKHRATEVGKDFQGLTRKSVLSRIRNFSKMID
ncbi:hypothetical protein [Cupriavidus necator]